MDKRNALGNYLWDTLGDYGVSASVVNSILNKVDELFLPRPEQTDQPNYVTLLQFAKTQPHVISAAVTGKPIAAIKRLRDAYNGTYGVMPSLLTSRDVVYAIIGDN